MQRSRVARTPGDTSQFFGQKDALGVCTIVGTRWTRCKLTTGIQGTRWQKKIHGTCFETHPRVAPLLGFLQQLLEQLLRHTLAPVSRGRAQRCDFGVLRVECFEGTTPRSDARIPHGPHGDVRLTQALKVSRLDTFWRRNPLHVPQMFLYERRDLRSSHIVSAYVHCVFLVSRC